MEMEDGVAQWFVFRRCILTLKLSENQSTYIDEIDFELH